MAEDYMKMPRDRRIEALLQAAEATKLRLRTYKTQISL